VAGAAAVVLSAETGAITFGGNRLGCDNHGTGQPSATGIHPNHTGEAAHGSSRGGGFSARRQLYARQARAHQKQTRSVLETNTHVNVLLDYTCKLLTGNPSFLESNAYYLLMHPAGSGAADSFAGFVLTGGGKQTDGA